MKQPKFRGFSKDTNSWHYGFGWCEIDYTEEFLKEKGISPQAMLYTETSPVECELSSMGNFIGTKDSNGKEIYNGDILKVKGSKRRYVVQWNEEEMAFIVSYKYANDKQTVWVFSEFRTVLREFEIIGNIYENPELITA